MCEKPKDTSSTGSNVISVCSIPLLILNSRKSWKSSQKAKMEHITFNLPNLTSLCWLLILHSFVHHVEQVWMTHLVLLRQERCGISSWCASLTISWSSGWISVAYKLPCQSDTLHIISVLILMTSVQNPAGNHFKCRIYSLHPHLECQPVYIWLTASTDQGSKTCT